MRSDEYNFSLLNSYFQQSQVYFINNPLHLIAKNITTDNR
jgi:hypothetical protein